MRAPPSTGDITGVNLYQVSGNATIIIAVNLSATTGQIHIKTTEGSIILDGIRITTGGSIKVEMSQSVSGTDGISIVGSLLDAGTYIDIYAKDGWVILSDSTIRAGSQGLTVSAFDGALDAEDALIESGSDLLFEATGDVSFQRSTLRAATIFVTEFLGTNTGRTVYLEDAVIDDADDVLNVQPTRTTISGSPTSGSWRY